MNKAYYVENLDDEIEVIPADSIISRTLHKDDDVKVILFGFAPGESLTEHTSAYPAALHIVRGEANITLGDEEVTGKPGTWIYMPASLPHSIRAQSELVMLLQLLQR